jgi:hypothetical protein
MARPWRHRDSSVSAHAGQLLHDAAVQFEIGRGAPAQRRAHAVRQEGLAMAARGDQLIEVGRLAYQ